MEAWLQWLELQVWAFVAAIMQWVSPGSSTSSDSGGWQRPPRCDWVFAPAPRGQVQVEADEEDELGICRVGICTCNSCIDAFTILVDSGRGRWRWPHQLRSEIPNHHTGWSYQPRLGWLFDGLTYSDAEPDAEPQAQEEQPLPPESKDIVTQIMAYRTLTSTDME